jgi:methionine sulfoxide reductase heme-binding subunit
MRMTWQRATLWLVLAIPAVAMLTGFARGTTLAMDLLHPTGETAIRLMILALLPGPLVDAFGPNRFLRFWVSVRRNLGVASFLYALLHLAFYIVDMQALAAILDELTLPAIWTGWLALALMVPAAAISFDRAVRAMGRRWKQVQRIVYVAIAATFAHWLLLDWEWQPAAIHLAPLIAAWSLRAWKRTPRRQYERIAS